LFTVGLLCLGCGGSSEEIQNLTGAGATFPFPVYSKWFDEYRKIHPTIQINYQSVGSGAGIKQVTEGTVDFGASDGPMNEEQNAAFKAKNSTGILHFPTVLGAVIPTYTLSDVSETLKFTPDALAGIFLGKVTKWNDAAIASANPGVKLPAAEIVVVHRSDGSGTTYVWTDYLSKVSKEWAAGPGKNTSVNWPVGLGGKGNEGVAGLVKQTANSIGYVEMIYAVQNKMPLGYVKNAAGNFVQPSLEAVTAAAAEVPMPDDFRVSITNSPAAQAYPIASFTWLLIPEQIQDAAKRETIVEFLKWMMGPGQGVAATLEYAPLPEAVIAKEQQALAAIH
jgi:phosphate transport system substrate-binding protein